MGPFGTDLWASEPKSTSAETAIARPYAATWGGGCTATPLTKEELCADIQQEGWPTQAEIDDVSMEETRVPPNNLIAFDESEEFNLWGSGRAARNVDRQSYDLPLQFEIIEKSVWRYMESLGKERAESGDVMLLVEGTSLGDPDRQFRSVVQVSGITWKPTVFDVTLNDFLQESDVSSAELGFPCEVVIPQRPCKVTPNFICLDGSTSDDWIKHLVHSMRDIQLSEVKYIVLNRDGSVLASRLLEKTVVGMIWEAGMTSPLSFRSPTQRSGPSSRAVARLGEALISGYNIIQSLAAGSCPFLGLT